MRGEPEDLLFTKKKTKEKEREEMEQCKTCGTLANHACGRTATEIDADVHFKVAEGTWDLGRTDAHSGQGCALCSSFLFFFREKPVVSPSGIYKKQRCYTLCVQTYRYCCRGVDDGHVPFL